MTTWRFHIVCLFLSIYLFARAEEVARHTVDVSLGAALTGIRENLSIPAGAMTSLGVLDVAWQYNAAKGTVGARFDVGVGAEYGMPMLSVMRPRMQEQVQLGAYWLFRIPLPSPYVRMGAGMSLRADMVAMHPILNADWRNASEQPISSTYFWDMSLGGMFQASYTNRRWRGKITVDVPLVMFGCFNRGQTRTGAIIESDTYTGNFFPLNVNIDKYIKPNTFAGVWNYTHPLAEMQVAYCVHRSNKARTYLHIYYAPQYLYCKLSEGATHYLRHTVGIGCTVDLLHAQSK